MHEQATMLFIKQPRFGVSRMGGWTRPDYDLVHAQKPDLTKNSRRDVPDFITKAIDETSIDQLRFLGNFNKRVEWLCRHDANLEPMKFRQVQLVGLLRPAKPVVYETDDITMGTNIDKIPTRPLDAFESWGVKELKSGKDLHIAKLKTGEVRVLGPIFAGSKCTGCHSQPGEMLGAFSYTFDVGPPKP